MEIIATSVHLIDYENGEIRTRRICFGFDW